MKIYIVTDGSYSDYSIQKVFSNRDAAEEYKKWHNCSNDIEEYEIYDEAFTEDNEEKTIFIRVQGTVYPEAVVDIRFDIHPEIIDNRLIRKDVGINSLFCKQGTYEIYYYNHISADKWDEEKYKLKFTKILYDLVAVARNLLSEGASIYDTQLALRNIDYREKLWETD